MKFIKNHLMFILPLMTILLGIEFYLVFERTTKDYEKSLTEGYTMLVVTKKPMRLSALKVLNKHVSSSEKIERNNIVSEVAQGVSEDTSQAILKALPYFYNVGLDSYIRSSELDDIKEDLEKDPNITRVETFGGSYNASYRLFMFIKISLKIFIGFMTAVSLLLVLKQMEIWKYAHKDRMQIMEIFGAPMMLRSGILFRVALMDALIATLLVSGIFFYIKLYWAGSSGIQIMVRNQLGLFQMSDVGLLFGTSMLIVIVSVYVVAFSSKGVQE